MFNRSIQRLYELLRGRNRSSVGREDEQRSSGTSEASGPVSLADSFRECFVEAQKAGIRPSYNGGFDLPARSPELNVADREIAKFATRGFLELCTEAGLEVISTMNPATFHNLLHIKNIGKKLAVVTISGKTFYFEPGENQMIDVPHGIGTPEFDVSAYNYEQS